MREDLLREVERDLQAQQARNEEITLRRNREAREKFPEIAELSEERRKLITSSMEGILRGEAAPDNLPGKMEEVSDKIRKALRARGLPEDWLSPVYTCPVCRDSGFVGETVRERCSCVRERYQRKLRAAIGLPEDGHETFERFDPGVFPETRQPGAAMSQRQAMTEIRDLCREWAETYPHQAYRDLILSGKSGLGKTFLLHAIANRLIERDAQVLLISAYTFLEIARKSYFENDGRMQELLETEVLMLDDLGSEPMMQNITIEQLFCLVNERQRRNRPTVISTNLNREELKERYTERIVSRLTDRRNCIFLPLEGRDIRNGKE